MSGTLPRLSSDELDHELQHPELASRTRIKGDEGKKKFLAHHLNNTFYVENDKIVSNFNKLLESISDTPAPQPSPASSLQPVAHGHRSDSTHQATDGMVTLPLPVSELSTVCFKDADFGELMRDLDLLVK